MGEQTCLHVHLCSLPTKVKYLLSQHMSICKNTFSPVRTHVHYLRVEHMSTYVCSIPTKVKHHFLSEPKVFKGTGPQNVVLKTDGLQNVVLEKVLKSDGPRKSLEISWSSKKSSKQLFLRCLPKEWLTPNALETQLAASGQSGVQPSNMAAVRNFYSKKLFFKCL